MEEADKSFLTSVSSSNVLPVPSGQWPDGTGESPVPPISWERMNSSRDSENSLNDEMICTRFLVRLVFRHSHEVIKAERASSQVLWQLNPVRGETGVRQDCRAQTLAADLLNATVAQRDIALPNVDLCRPAHQLIRGQVENAILWGKAICDIAVTGEQRRGKILVGLG